MSSTNMVLYIQLKIIIMFDFLKNLGDVEVTSGKVEGQSTRIVRKDANPTNGADLRLFKDGSVYPSKELVAEFELEYTNKDTVTGNGFDVIDTRTWAGWKADTHVLLIAPISKSKSKVDLFDQTKYNEDGTPISTVVDQGSNTFGKKLLTMISEIYGDVDFTDKSYVDLVIGRGYNFATEEGIYYIPKAVVKGDKKGAIKVVRREYTSLYPLVIFQEESSPEGSVDSEDELADISSFDVVSYEQSTN
jgi:hypothetical protein